MVLSRYLLFGYVDPQGHAGLQLSTTWTATVGEACKGLVKNRTRAHSEAVIYQDSSTKTLQLLLIFNLMVFVWWYLESNGG